MFSKELAALFTGRTVQLKVWPLSFKTLYNEFKETNPEKFLKKYLVLGGLGLIVDSYNETKLTQESLKIVITDTIENDISVRRELKNDESILKKVIHYCFEHVGRDINSLRLENYFKSNEKTTISYKTIINYLEWLTDAQIIYRIKYFDIKGLKTLLTNSMYYAGDLGLLSSVIGYDLKTSKGYRLENLVFLELLSQDYELETGFDKNKNSVDFIARKDDEVIYIQVTDEMNEENQDREYKPLIIAKNATRKIILTNAMNVPKPNNGVKIVFLTEWLLGNTRLY